MAYNRRYNPDALPAYDISLAPNNLETLAYSAQLRRTRTGTPFPYPYFTSRPLLFAIPRSAQRAPLAHNHSRHRPQPSSPAAQTPHTLLGRPHHHPHRACRPIEIAIEIETATESATETETAIVTATAATTPTAPARPKPAPLDSHRRALPRRPLQETV